MIFCQSISAHKAILAAASPIFKAMFYGDLPEKGDVRIINATSSAFEIFLQVIYGMYKNISNENISNVMRLAHNYGCHGAMQVCTSYLNEKIDEDNVCLAVSLAIKYDLAPRVFGKCLYVITDNAYYVLQSDGFADVDYESLDYILIALESYADEKLFVDSCMKWAQKACEKQLIEPTPVNLRAALGHCFSYIKFKEMALDDFLEIERLYPVFDLNEYRDIVTAINSRHVDLE